MPLIVNYLKTAKEWQEVKKVDQAVYVKNAEKEKKDSKSNLKNSKRMDTILNLRIMKKMKRRKNLVRKKVIPALVVKSLKRKAKLLKLMSQNPNLSLKARKKAIKKENPRNPKSKIIQLILKK